MTPETRDKARRIADLAFGEADYGTVVDAIANAISSALSQPSGEVERMKEALGQIVQKADNGTSHGLLADGYCEEIATIARAALNGGESNG